MFQGGGNSKFQRFDLTLVCLKVNEGNEGNELGSSISREDTDFGEAFTFPLQH